jgi:hypothetical protein
MYTLERPPSLRARVVSDRTGRVVYEGGGVHAELEAIRLVREAGGSDRFHVEVEIAPGTWGRMTTFGGF